MTTPPTIPVETIRAALRLAIDHSTDPDDRADFIDALAALEQPTPVQTPAPQACPTRSPYQRLVCDLPNDPDAHAADGHVGTILTEHGPTRITWPTTVEDHDRWGTRL